MIAQHVSVQLEVVGDELVVGTECLPSASLRALRLKGVFAEFFAARKPRVSPRSWAEHVDQLGKIDNRPLRRVGARDEAPTHIRHAGDFFRWNQEVAGRESGYIGHAQCFRV